WRGCCVSRLRAADPGDGDAHVNWAAGLDQRAVPDEILVRQLEPKLRIDAGQVGRRCGLREGAAGRLRNLLERGRPEGLRVQADGEDPDVRALRELPDLVQPER